MAGFGDYYNKKQKKLSKLEMAKRATKGGGTSFVLPQPEVIRKGKRGGE